MAFRTLEITKPADIHIKNSQLEITQEEGSVFIPLEDLSNIMTIGADIRLSTMDLSILAQNHIALTTLDEKYSPTAIVLPFKGNSRQSQLIHKQIEFATEQYEKIWAQIIRQKINNQARVLSLLDLEGMEKVLYYTKQLTDLNIDAMEATAAKEYFQFFHKGLNRREDDPINSRLNYGYAVVRSAIARAIVAVGCHPALGIHHNNQLNAFNLADDLIEPFRPAVDLVVYGNVGFDVVLNKSERREIAGILHNACLVNGVKMNMLHAIEFMAESYKRILLGESSEDLALPTVISIEKMEGITE